MNQLVEFMEAVLTLCGCVFVWEEEKERSFWGGILSEEETV